MADRTASLLGWFTQCSRCVVAFSGGVDSAVVAAAAVRSLGNRALAVTAVSPTTPRRDKTAASRIAAEIGIRHQLIETHELDAPLFRANTPERCYHCKAIRLADITALAKHENDTIVVEGSNADDTHDFRPGRRACQELGIRSPLAELGIVKSEVRVLARAWSLSCAEQPSEPCLATRLAYGVEITPAQLAQIDAAEEFVADILAAHGAPSPRPLRMRLHHDGLARLELRPELFAIAIACRNEITTALYAVGLPWVTLDLAGFQSGSMNRRLNATSE